MATTVITTTATTTVTATTIVTMVTVTEPPTQMQLALPTEMGIISSYPAREAMAASTAMPRASSAATTAATTTRQHTTNTNSSSSICSSSNRRNRSMQPASMELAPLPRITTSCSSRNTVAASMATQHPLLAPLPARALCPVRVAPIWWTSSWCCRLCRLVFQTNHKMASRISSSRPSIWRASAISVRVHRLRGKLRKQQQQQQ